MKQKHLFAVIGFMLLFSVTLSAQVWENLLDFSGIPFQDADNAFFDEGSRHGFGLPPASSRRFKASFTGPYIQGCNDQWSSKSLFIPEFKDGQSVKVLKIKGCDSSVYPGFLQQKYSAGLWNIRQRLFFINADSAIITIEAENGGSKVRTLNFTFKGKPVLESKKSISKDKVELYYRSSCDLEKLTISTNGKMNVVKNSFGYKFNLIDIPKVEPGEKILITVAITFEASGRTADFDFVNYALENSAEAFETNREVWRKKIAAATVFCKTDIDKLIAVKSLMVLAVNHKSACGSLPIEGVYPASTFFKGIWGWDSWKHAAALAGIDHELAKNSIISMYAFMDDDGFIPDCLFPDPKMNNYRDTKPPLSGWAAWRIHERNNDMEFLKAFYPKLVKQHQWWYTWRDHDKNGLCEYGSQDGSIQATKWESGMDNAARFDGRKMVKNESGWSIDSEAVDLNSYLYREKLALVDIAEALGLTEDAQKWQKKAEILKAQINTFFFNKEQGFYYDIDLFTKKPIKLAGSEGWLPLWAGAAGEEEAKAVRDAIMDPSKFNTKVPLPTLAADDLHFMKGNSYWRGRVWIDQLYFGISGLANYGYVEEAAMLTKATFANSEGLTDAPGPIYENYNPMDGSGMGAMQFSWSAAHFLMLANRDYR